MEKTRRAAHASFPASPHLPAIFSETLVLASAIAPAARGGEGAVRRRERRRRGGAARAQWLFRQEARRAGAGCAGRGRVFPGRPPPRIVKQAGPARQGTGPARLPGMVSKALLRLVSAVNRRRMKLLLGLALLAYVACECAPAPAGEPHSFPGPRRRGWGGWPGTAPGRTSPPRAGPAPPALRSPGCGPLSLLGSCSGAAGQVGHGQ